MSRIAKYSNEDLISAVKGACSWSMVCRKLGLRVAGGTIENLKKKVEKNSLDTSHFKGKGWQKGLNRYTSKGVARQAGKLEKPWNDVFCNDSEYNNAQRLLRRLVRSNVRELKCEVCGVHKWNERAMVFELHHMNSNHTDNRESNLQIVCPNCHGQVHMAKNTQIFYDICNIEGGFEYIEIGEKEKPKKPKKPRPRKFEVTKEELEQLILTDSYCAIGRRFGVSDNAIRKRAKKYGII